MAKDKIVKTEVAVIRFDQVEQKIFLIRDQKVMLDKDLAEMYDVPTKVFNQAVSRNLERFPTDFRFQLTSDEFVNLRSQFVTSSLRNYGGRRYMPYVFTEQGVAMLSSVLNSARAVQVNIAIMRAFVNMRWLVATNAEISKKLDAIERKLETHDGNFKEVFAAIRAMMAPDRQPKQIGYIKNTR
ncbi:MAG: ORF6N domain-containing protein [Pyrinomonadaceae bacterium]